MSYECGARSCSRTAEPTIFKKNEFLPAGWGEVTIREPSGRVRSSTLCPSHINAVMGIVKP